jgi:predicted rRNA methylase YqxC with S4 and FtsJ domains
MPGSVLQAPQPKQRRIKLLDACIERFPEHSARVLSSLIIQGKVLVDDAPQYKAGTLVAPTVPLRIRGAPCQFVSRWVCAAHS